MDLATMSFELLGGRVGLLLARAPDADISARFGHRIGHAEADAAVATGHQRHLAGEIEALIGHEYRPPSFSSPVIRGRRMRGKASQPISEIEDLYWSFPPPAFGHLPRLTGEGVIGAD